MRMQKFADLLKNFRKLPFQFIEVMPPAKLNNLLRRTAWIWFIFSYYSDQVRIHKFKKYEHITVEHITASNSSLSRMIKIKTVKRSSTVYSIQYMFTKYHHIYINILSFDYTAVCSVNIDKA